METSTQPTYKAPEALTIGGITYRTSDNPDLQAFVSNIIAGTAQNEKTKLYAKIELLNSRVAEMEASEKQIMLALENAKKNNAPAIDYDRIGEIVKSSLSVIETNLSSKVGNLISPVVASIEKQEVKDLESYRTQLLRENDGKCMPELVSGTTKESIDASMKLSKEMFDKYKPVTATATTDAQVQTTATTTQPVVETKEVVTPAPFTVPPVTNTPGQGQLPDIKNMSQDEFAKNREELRAKLAASL